MPLEISGKKIPTNTGPIVVKSAPINQIIRTFNIINLQRPNNNNEYKGKIDQTITRDPELYKSSLGTPVVANISFDSISYTDNNGKVKTTPDQFYDTVLLTVNQSKKIITTEIQGFDGTVKEYIGLDDYQVTINGIIAGKNGSYPADEVLALKKMLDAPVAIHVVCKYLNDLGIYNLVFKEYAFDQQSGGYSQQPFTLTAISDIPINLEIT